MDLAGTTEKQLEEWSAAVSKYQMLLASVSWILRDWSQMTSRNMLNHFMLHQPFRSIFFPGSHCIPSGFVRLLDALTCGRCFRIPSPPQKGLWPYWRCLQARLAGFPDQCSSIVIFHIQFHLRKTEQFANNRFFSLQPGGPKQTNGKHYR